MESSGKKDPVELEILVQGTKQENFLTERIKSIVNLSSVQPTWSRYIKKTKMPVI